MKKNLPFLLVVFLLGTTTIHAQQWTMTNGPSGGMMEHIASKGDVLIAASVSRAYRSGNYGDSWSRLGSITLVNGLVSSNDFFFLAGILNGQNGFFRSVDGITWANVHPSPTELLREIAADDNGKLVLISVAAATWRIHISEDGGNTWLSKDLPYQNIQSVYVRGSRILLGTFSNGLAQSFDDGETWTSSLMSGFASVGNAVLSGNNIIACLGSAFVSSDDGATWTTSTSLNGVSALFSSGDLLFGGGLSGLKSSSDHGITWEQVPGMPFTPRAASFADGRTYFGTTGGVFAFDNASSGITDISNSLYSLQWSTTGTSLQTDGTNIFAASFASGISRTSDDGLSWQRVNNGLNDYGLSSTTLLILNGRILSGGAARPIYYSDDLGETWMRSTSSIGHVEALISVNNVILTGGQSGGPPIFRSTDDGLSWHPSSNGLPSGGSFSVKAFLRIGTVLFAAHTAGLYRSVDLGQTWSLVSSAMSGATSLYFFNGSLFAVRNGLYRSADGGFTFGSVNLPGFPIYSFAHYQGLLFIGTGNGVYFSSNGGTSWSPYGAAIGRVHALVVKGQTLFAAVNENAVMKAPITGGALTFSPIPPKSYGNQPFPLNAASNSGWPISYTSSNSAVATIQGNMLTIRGAGQAIITALINDGLGTRAEQTLVVQKAPLTVTADDKTWQYGTGVQPFTISYSGFVNGDTEENIEAPVIELDASSALNAGEYALTPVGGSSNNYNFTIVPGKLTITRAPLTVTANNASMIYGDNLPPLAISYSGFIGSDDISVIDEAPHAVAAILVVAPSEPKNELSDSETLPAEQKEPITTGATEALPKSGTATLTPVGTYPINVVGGHDNNYEIVPVAGVLTINKAPLTIRPQNIEREYGEVNPPISLTYEGFKGTEDQSVLSAAPIASSDAQQFSDVGEYTITISGGSASNYDFILVNGSLTVTRALLAVTAEPTTIEYGDEPQLTYVYSGFKGTDDGSGIDTPPVISFDYEFYTQEPGSRYLNVGEYIIRVSGGADNNYELNYTFATLVVQQAPLRIDAPYLHKVYGDPNPEFTLTYTGFKGDEDATTINFPPSVESNVETFSPVGSYEIFISPGSDKNYAITVVGGRLTVDPAPLVVKPDDMFKVYGEPPSEDFTIRYEGFKGTDNSSVLQVAPIATTTVSAVSDAGSYPIVVEGGIDDNYTLQYVNGLYTVTKAPLIVTAVDQQTLYGDPLSKPTLLFDGFVGDDDVNALDEHPRADYKIPITAFEIQGVPNAGTYAIGVVTPIDNNYDIIPVHGKLIINKAPLYVDFVPVEVVYGDELPKIVLQYHGFRAIDGKSMNADGVENLERLPKIFVAGSPRDAGTYPVTISDGFDNNYELEYFTGGYVRITPAVLTLWVENQTLEYGNDAQIDMTVHAQGFKGTDDMTVIDTPPVAEMVHKLAEKGSQFRTAGEYEIYLLAGGDNNYKFQLLPSLVTITKAPLKAEPIDVSKIYGDENPVFQINYEGLKGTETGMVINNPPIATTMAHTSSSVGEYPITLSGGEDDNYEISVEDGILSITKAPLNVIAENRSKLYGQEFWMSLSVNYEGFKGTDDASVLDVAPTVSTSVTATSNAGTYPIVVTGGSDLNYALTYVDGVFTVNKVTLTATADDKTRVYGEANPEFTLTYAGFVNGEDASVIDMPPCVLFVADELSPPGTYPIYFDGGSDINYDFNLIPGTLTITELTTPITGKPTSTCYLTSPANYSTNVNYYVTLTSNFVAGANTYTMEVNTRADFTGASIVKQGKQDIPFLLAYDTRYYVRIQTDQAPGAWSVTSTFTTGNPLSLSYIISPEDGSAGVPTNVKVTANNLYGADTYTVELNTRADFTGTSIVETGTARGISFKKLDKATTYFARVTSDLTPGQWGRVTSFTTQDPSGRTHAWVDQAEENFEADGISYNIYPNPFAEKIIVHVQTLEQTPVDLRLFDMSGKMHDAKTANTNSLVSLGEGVSRGVYLLQVVTVKGRRFIRVVKE